MKEESDIADALPFIGLFGLGDILDENPSDYQWNDKKKLFVNSKTGKMLTARQMRNLIDEIITYLIAQVPTLPEDSQIVRDAYSDFWSTFVIALTATYLLGAGGKPVYTDAKEAIDQMLREQLDYYQRFGDQIAKGDLSIAQIQDRFRMYANSLRGVYQQGRLRAYGLDIYPVPGTVKCGSNCRCTLSIREYRNRWEIRWIRSAWVS